MTAFTAPQKPRHKGPAAPSMILPGQPAPETLLGDATVDVAIIGGSFAGLAGVRQEFTWAGHSCLARYAVSVARELEPGPYAATVCNGLGTTRSTLTGIAAADLALAQETDNTRHFAAEAAPNNLPPKPFSTIGANMLLRFKEWRAGSN